MKAIVILVVFAVIALVMGFFWNYAISTWLVFIGKPDTFHYWHGCLLSLVPGIGQAGIVVAAITFVLMLFL